MIQTKKTSNKRKMAIKKTFEEYGKWVEEKEKEIKEGERMEEQQEERERGNNVIE